MGADVGKAFKMGSQDLSLQIGAYDLVKRPVGKRNVTLMRAIHCGAPGTKRVEPGQFPDHQSLSSGNATVRPKLIVVCGAIGAYCRYAIHCPVTKRLIGGSPGSTSVRPRPTLSGNIVGEW